MLARIRAMFFKRSDDGFDEEFETHLALLTEENLRRGMPADEARRMARVRLGGITQMKETRREIRGLPRIDTVLQDIRYAFRMLRRSPGFTLAAVLTLALGIGLNTTVFTVYDSIALRLLPVKNPSSVVRLMRWYTDGSRNDEFTQNDYETVRDHTNSFSAVAAASAPLRVLAQTELGAGTELVQTRLVSGNYFSMLGVSAATGRTFLPEEDDRMGAHPVAVVSHRFWVRRFLSDPLILGRTILLNGTAFTFVGVAPESFAGTGSPPEVPDLWIPLAMHEQLSPRQDTAVQLLCIRKPEVSPQRVQSEMAVLGKALEPPQSASGRKLLRLAADTATFFDQNSGGFEVFLWVIGILMGAVTSVLLIGCVNLVNLMLARAMTRHREIAVRCALGAARWRILRQLCTESALIGLLGGAVGLVLSVAICRYLAAVLASKLATFGVGAEYLFVDVSPSGVVFAYTLLISIVTGILVGLAPARQAMRTDVASAMKQETAVSLGGRGRFRDVLIAAQVAFCLVLLVGAGLLGRGVLSASHADPGFETRRIFMMYIPDAALGSTQIQRDSRMAEVFRRLKEIPQVTEVSLTRTPPMLGHGTANFEPLGSQVSMRSPESRALFNSVSPQYFNTLGIPVLRGRIFTQQEVDGDAPVTVISEATARRYWQGGEPLGKRISVWKGLSEKRIAGRTFTVIGVVKSVRSVNLSKVDPAYIYFPGSYADAPLFLVRTELPPRAAMPLMRDAAAGTDRALGSQIMMMNVEAGPVQLQRLMTEAPAMVAAVLGGLGMLLAAVGIYGVVAYLVSRRTREIGVRLALGASRRDVMALVFRQALKPVLWGVPVGLTGSVMLSVALGKMVVMAENPDPLFGANPWSPSTFAAVLLFLVVIVWLASWTPARRATRIDPAVALRYE
jgi:macrolide transport system ATP-binding/permease protein